MASATVPGTVNVFGNQPVILQQVNGLQGFTENNAKRVTALGAVQIAVGIFAIVFQAVATGIARDAREPLLFGNSMAELIGCGIWCGVVFMISGLLGVLAGKRNRTCLIMTFLVFNIVIAVLVWVLVGFAAGSLPYIQYCPNRSVIKSRLEQNTYYYSSISGYLTSRIENTTYYYTDYVNECSTLDWAVGRAWQAMDCLLIITAICEFAIAVASAAYCCRALPCCTQRQPVFVVQTSAGPAGTYYYGPSMQPIFLQQDSSIQGQVFPNPAMVAGPVNDSTGLSSAQFYPLFVRAEMPSASVNGASTSIGQHVASARTAPTENHVSKNDMNAPPNYCELGH